MAAKQAEEARRQKELLEKEKERALLAAKERKLKLQQQEAAQAEIDKKKRL